MEEAFIQQLISFGGLGLLCAYLFFDNRRKDAKIKEDQAFYAKKEELYNQRETEFFEKSLAMTERMITALSAFQPKGDHDITKPTGWFK